MSMHTAMSVTCSKGLRVPRCEQSVARLPPQIESKSIHHELPTRTPAKSNLHELPTRRSALLTGICLGAASSLGVCRPEAAQAGIVEDLAKAWTRPEVSPEVAIMQLMDARGTLKELRALASTPLDSQERFEARARLPGMAARLREVASAAPVVAGLATGTGGEAALSQLYGGKGDDAGAAVPVYTAIGKVVTISGRTIRKEAQASPELADEAIQVIDELLGLLPKNMVTDAQVARQARLIASR